MMHAARQAVREDLPETMRIEQCWPEHERASLAQFEARIARYPAGFLVVGEEGALEGVMTACPIEYDRAHPELLTTWDAVTTGGGCARQLGGRSITLSTSFPVLFVPSVEVGVCSKN